MSRVKEVETLYYDFRKEVLITFYNDYLMSLWKFEKGY